MIKRESMYHKMPYGIANHSYLFNMEKELLAHDMNIKKVEWSLYE